MLRKLWERVWWFYIKSLWALTLSLYAKGKLSQSMFLLVYRYIRKRLPGYTTFEKFFNASQARQDWPAAALICEDWLTLKPDNTASHHSNRIHKLHIDMLSKANGMDLAFAKYGLIRKDKRPIQLTPHQDIIGCAVVRNERLRLPYFLEYHRNQGITRFLIVENNSTDQTLEYLLSQPDVHVWHTAASYRGSNCGAAWWQLLLSRYGIGHWALIVDADELFYYPNCERKSIVELCNELEAAGKTAYRALHVDLYSQQPVERTTYQPGQDFLSVCPYFDRDFYHIHQANAGPFKCHTNYMGGVRMRVFGGRHDGYILNKVPLFKPTPDTILSSGQHWLNHPHRKFSEQRGALLHFKYFSTFSDHVRQEVKRKEHPNYGGIYRQYAKELDGHKPLCLFDARYSIRFEDSQQLTKLGIMLANEHG